MYKNFKKGFTLVELLVVIAIILILSGILFTSFGPSRAKARDAKRVADINSIALSLELHFSKKGYFPTSLEQLKTDNYLSKIPTDPTTGVNYQFHVFNSEGNDSGKCDVYHLGATMETALPDGDTNLNSSGKGCVDIDSNPTGTNGFNGNTTLLYDIITEF